MDKAAWGKCSLLYKLIHCEYKKFYQGLCKYVSEQAIGIWSFMHMQNIAADKTLNNFCH